MHTKLQQPSLHIHQSNETLPENYWEKARNSETHTMWRGWLCLCAFIAEGKGGKGAWQQWDHVAKMARGWRKVQRNFQAWILTKSTHAGSLYKYLDDVVLLHCQQLSLLLLPRSLSIKTRLNSQPVLAFYVAANVWRSLNITNVRFSSCMHYKVGGVAKLAPPCSGNCVRKM